LAPNPILKVLSTFKKHKVKSLLIGGQACIIYGAAEFSRDSDFVILCNNENIEHLKEALDELKAEPIYFPSLKAEYLERGHACHFRCKAADVLDLRVDIMAKMRGCDPFENLWLRRKTINVKYNGAIDVIGLTDLVQSKKTQRDKDWFMLKQLVENDINNKNNPPKKTIKWWFMESRSADSLIKLSKKYPAIAKECLKKRPLLESAIAPDAHKLDLRFNKEESTERQKDVEYWEPLKRELEVLRHGVKNPFKNHPLTNPKT